MAAAGHELRTPVAALHGFLQLVERQLHDDPEGAAAYLERSITETRRLGELVTRLFDVALVQHGRLALTHESLELVATVRDAIDTARVLYPEVEFQIISTPRSVRESRRTRSGSSRCSSTCCPTPPSMAPRRVAG